MRINSTGVSVSVRHFAHDSLLNSVSNSVLDLDLITDSVWGSVCHSVRHSVFVLGHRGIISKHIPESCYNSAIHTLETQI